MLKIGIMQGRLTPPWNGRLQCFPVDRWKAEFLRAHEAKLDCIEWIYDGLVAATNPITSDGGIALLLELQRASGIQVRSICADYFMEYPLTTRDNLVWRKRVAHLRWLISRCGAAGIRRIVLPFVDNSAIRTEDEWGSARNAIEAVAPSLAEENVEIQLETSLGPENFSRFLAGLPADLIGVNYDIGNSASLGYLTEAEFSEYGARIGGVHVKDRLRAGSSVPLGSGDARFAAVFEGLGRVGYSGDLILQVARGRPGDEVAWAKANRDFVAELVGREE